LSVFDRGNLPALQSAVLSGEIDSDTLLPDLLEYVDTFYYNLFCNLDSGEHAAIPVSRRGNPQFALRQSMKKSMLSKILRKTKISYKTHEGLFSHLHFMTLTFDHNQYGRDEANFLITSKGKAISKYFARLEKYLEGGYSKIIVKESTVSGYPAVHILLYLKKPLKIVYHRKSNSYRPDPSDPYTKQILGQWKDLSSWNSPSPIWRYGFVDVHSFTDDRMKLKGHSNPINYISKYISKSLNLEGVSDIKECKRVSDLPVEYRTKTWTILNSLIWNSHTWIISKAFKEDLQKMEARRDKLKGNWIRVKTVGRDNPELYTWMGYTPEEAQIMASENSSLSERRT